MNKVKTVNENFLNELYLTATKSFSIISKIGISIPPIKLAFEQHIKNIPNAEKIKTVCKYLDKKGYIYPPQIDLSYHDEYFCKEKLFFQKIDFIGTDLISKYKRDELSLLISTDRSLSPYGNHPLIILPENLEEYGDFMDGASGYSVFKLLMSDCLKISDESILSFPKSTNFAQNPIKFFRDIGCIISEPRQHEIMYQKRVIAWDEDDPNVIYTFGYYLYIISKIHDLKQKRK